MEKVVLSLDEVCFEQALKLAAQFGSRVYAVKVHNLFDMHGPSIVEQLRAAGAKRVWVDAKLHDIKNTVRLRAKALANAGADILSVHASGGVLMMEAAVAAFSSPREVYAVTVLTSIDELHSQQLYGRTPAAMSLRLARLAMLARVGGVVCSAMEVQALAVRPEFAGMKFIVPGVRSAGKALHDQERTSTPCAALKSGADRIVIGRQITQARNPAKEFDLLEAELGGYGRGIKSAGA